MFEINKMPASIDIGIVGETNFRTIQIDMSAWMEDMPAGVPSIIHMRPAETEEDAYIAATTFDSETNVLSWTITAGDLGLIDGEGIARIWLEELDSNDEVAKRGKSLKIKTIIHGDEALDPTDEPPAAQAAWLEQMTDLKVATVNAKTAADDAKTAAQAAKTAAEAAQTGAENAAEHFEDFFDVNDFNSDPDGKVNVMTVPYSVDEFAFGDAIYADGSIRPGTVATLAVSPLIPIEEGTYGLKISYNQYNLGKINTGNDGKNGYTFLASDGETVVARPETLIHNISGDIYVFDAPEGAAYVRFCFICSTSKYYETAVSYFNEWILLPDADDNIDNTFFTLATQRPNGVVNKIMRNDGSHLEIIDEKNRANVAVDWTEYSASAFAVGDYVIKDGVLYRFTSAHTAGDAWSSSEVTQITLSAEVKSLKTDVAGKANKVANPTSGNFVAFDSNGNLKDSGHSHSDYMPSGSSSGAEAWLIRNNLDANPSGKYNLLNVPYSIDDVLNGKTIAANGSIIDAYNAASSVSPLIPISAGTYGLKVSHGQYYGNISSGNSYKNGYGFFASDGETVVSRPTTLLHNISGDIYVFDVPEGAAYVRFSYESAGANYYADALEYFNEWVLLPDANDYIDASFFTLSSTKEDGEINKLTRVDGSHLEIVDTIARANASEALAMPITFGRRTFAIFEKVACIGDSYTSGYIVDTQGVAHTSETYSWVEHLKNITGRSYVNLGIGGATSASWLTSENGLAKAQIAANKAQAYIIGLQINDAARELPVGTSADIGTSTQSYYGCISKIVDEMFTINGDAHIFLLTQPKHYSGTHTPYQAAIRAIAEWYQTTGNGTHQSQVHLIDLEDYYKLFSLAGCNDAIAGGHFTPVGYEYVAEIMLYALSNYLNAHPLTFQDVNLIPYGS